jgi:hypothetical protein
MSKVTENALDSLFSIVVEGIAEKIKTGEAKASDYANAIKLLKDNGITVDVDSSGALDPLTGQLPFSLDNIPDEETQQ